MTEEEFRYQDNRKKVEPMTHDFDKALSGMGEKAPKYDYGDWILEHYETIRHALAMAKVTGELVDAVRFYANEDHWKQEVREDPCGCCTSFEGFEVQNDDGDKARHALTAYEAAIKDRGM